MDFGSVRKDRRRVVRGLCMRMRYLLPQTRKRLHDDTFVKERPVEVPGQLDICRDCDVDTAIAC